MARSQVLDSSALADAIAIVEDVRLRGESAVRSYAAEFDRLTAGDQLVFGPEELGNTYESVSDVTRQLLERTASRIERFARAQRATLSDLDVEVPGGRAGHILRPVASVGAYAPGGRYPLPSTVLMTVVPARVAGVTQVWVASPRPNEVTLAAAHVAGADGLLAIGGAQAIAAMAFGTLSPRCDLIVGPGNKWITAAKKHLFGEIGIDGLAGPSEIMVIADSTSDPSLVARDLIAQAEHDPDARPILVAFSFEFMDRVDGEIALQLYDLPTATIAADALATGMSVVVDDIESAAMISNALAPEHLALHTEEALAQADLFTEYGSVFLGPQSAEAFADYGTGPNHVLPTGGSARFHAGLSISTFLRPQTWLQVEDAAPMVQDVTALARLEGLEGHARAALARRRTFDA